MSTGLCVGFIFKEIFLSLMKGGPGQLYALMDPIEAGPEEFASTGNFLPACKWRCDALSIFEREQFCLGNTMDRGAWQSAVHEVKRVGHT